MATVSQIVDSEGNVIDLADKVTRTDQKGNTIQGFTSNTGTVTNVAAGAGLGYIDVENTNIIREFHVLISGSTTSNTAASKGSTSNREYPVGLDKNGKLSVNVPWEDTTLTAGTNITISSGAIRTSNIGARKAHPPVESKSVPNLTATLLNTIWSDVEEDAFPAGKYIVICYAAWSKNQYGCRQLYLTTSQGGSAIDRYSISQVAALTNNSSNAMGQQLVYCLQHNGTDSNPYHLFLYGYQNSGATLTASNASILTLRLA